MGFFHDFIHNPIKATIKSAEGGGLVPAFLTNGKTIKAGEKLLKKTDNVLLGRKPSINTTQALKTIAPIGEHENYFANNLFDLNKKRLGLLFSLEDQRNDLLSKTLENYQHNAGDIANHLNEYRGLINGYNPLYTGVLSTPLSSQLNNLYHSQLSNIDSYAKDGVGSLLNQMANRGIINSTVTGKALGDIGTNAMRMKNDAYTNYIDRNLNEYDRQYNANNNAHLAKLQALGNIATVSAPNPYERGLGLVDNLYNSNYTAPDAMWRYLRGTRYGLKNQTVVSGGSKGILGDLIKGGASIMASDKRLKTNITKVKESDGTPVVIDGHQIYDWDWNEEGQKLTGQKQGRGVIAQEVIKTRPDAIITDDPSGYLIVNYGKLFGKG